MKLRRLMQNCRSRTQPTKGQHCASQQNCPANDREWDDSAVLRPRQQAKLARGAKDEEHAMSHKPRRHRASPSREPLEISNRGVIDLASIAERAGSTSPID